MGNMSDAVSLTDLIHRAQDGDAAALRSVFDATYPQLRDLARVRLGGGGRGTFLNTTSLVHESYLRFANAGRLSIDDRAHFMRYAGRVMRSIIVDFVRERLAQRRGGGALHVTLNSQIDAAPTEAESEILRVHDALEQLAQYDARMVSIIEMRYFGGMTEIEVADALDITDRTVRREWEKARLLLAEALE